MLADAFPGKLFGHVAINMDHYILVFGGRLSKLKDCSHTSHVIFMYNLYTEQWRKHVIPQGQTVPEKTYYACAAAIGADVYMFGGFMLKERRLTNAVWKLVYDPQGSFAWSEIVATNNMNTPSPRNYHTGWEYEEKLWTFGGHGKWPNRYLNEFGDFVNRCNNQLLCFNPSTEEWTNPQCYGMIPEPRAFHVTTKCHNKVWLYGGSSDRWNVFKDLLELDMHSCTWTLIQTLQIENFARACMYYTLSTLSVDKLIVHGVVTSKSIASDTWILDLPTKTWRKYPQNLDTDISRSGHTGSQGINNNVVIIGGALGTSNKQSMQHNAIFHILDRT